MLSIVDNYIKLTRGDTAYLEVPIMRLVSTDPDEYEEYEIRDRDVLILTIKTKYTDEEVVLKKELTGTNIFHITPTDTADKKFGKYDYDVEIRTENGDRFTVIPLSKFELTAEVGW